MIECYKNENLTYDNLYDELSEYKEEYQIDEDFNEDNRNGKKSCKKIYTKEEIENILRVCIENMVIEIENLMDEKFKKYNFICEYNRYVDEWNEILCSIYVNGKMIEVKLSNDYRCDDSNNISSVYITLYSGGKGVFTECIERINQEYEFIESTYAYVPVTENELCFKELDKDKFIECIVSEINKMI